MAQEIAIVNGVLSPEKHAFVPVLDRGFLFGDSVYEVIRTRNGIPFLFDDHFERLSASSARIDMKLPLTKDELKIQIKRGLKESGFNETYIRIIVSRGISPPNINPRLAEGNTWVILFRKLELPPKEEYENGISTHIPNIFRNDRQALDPAIKSGNYLNNILALKEALEKGAKEAIIQNREGYITEATTANVFIVENGKALTPPCEEGILHGITRKLILNMAKENNLPCAEERIPLERFLKADEIFITSTLRDILPVTKINGKPVGNGKPGPVTKKFIEAFQIKAEEINKKEMDEWE